MDRTSVISASPAAVRADRTARGTRIDLDDVAKRFRIGDVTVSALEEVNLHVDESALVVILGPSGSGKTTLLNLIGALDTPTEGRIRIGGVDITTASRRERFRVRRETVSFVFQSFNLFPGLTALENVQFGTEVAGRPDDGIAASVLEQVGLADRMDHFAPFFTTKDVGKGTGLGLDISRRIVVERHHGEITIESQPGATVFRVSLPFGLDQGAARDGIPS